ncbi:syntaxin-7 [Acrasis kona]|uniref:Syntaxin-7 n=1 Tax=Acrasis kona TaxID=1008807 RepID=A0AAW2ZKH1_9EUKA
MIPSKHPTLIEDNQAVTYGSIVSIHNNSHESYLCVSLMSTLTANRSKVGLWEQFIIESAEGETRIGEPVCFTDFIHLKGYNGKYVAVASTGTLKCKTDTPTDNTSFCINSGDELKTEGIDMSTVPVMNHSNISIWSNSVEKYVAATRLGAAYCDRAVKGPWESFKIQMTQRQPLSDKYKASAKAVNKKTSRNNDLYDQIVVPRPSSPTIPEKSASSIKDHGECGAAMETLFNEIKCNHSDAADELINSIDAYFNGFSNKTLLSDLQLDRLYKQYKNIKKEYEQTKKAKKKKAKPQVAHQDDFDNEQDAPQQQMQQQVQAKPKMKLSASDYQTFQVEKKIAQETYEAVKELETEYNDLHLLMKDVNTLLHEQEDSINMVEVNVEYANHNIEKGRANIKTARKYNLT